MATKTILVVSSLALAFAAQPASAGNAAPNVTNASPQQISTPTGPASDDQPSAQPAKRHHHRNAKKRRHQRQQQQLGNPQPAGSAPNPG